MAHREDLGNDDAWKDVPITKEVETLSGQYTPCFADLPLGKMTPRQLNRPIIILKHCISIFLSMKFHLDVVPAEK